MRRGRRDSAGTIQGASSAAPASRRGRRTRWMPAAKRRAAEQAAAPRHRAEKDRAGVCITLIQAPPPPHAQPRIDDHVVRSTTKLIMTKSAPPPSGRRKSAAGPCAPARSGKRPHPRPLEDLFHHDCERDEVAELDAGDGDDRDQRVPQRMREVQRSAAGRGRGRSGCSRRSARIISARAGAPPAPPARAPG